MYYQKPAVQGLHRYHQPTNMFWETFILSSGTPPSRRREERYNLCRGQNSSVLRRGLEEIFAIVSPRCEDIEAITFLQATPRSILL